MASPYLSQAKPLRVRVNFSSAKLAEIENELRTEFGPFVVSPERVEELKEILALADEDIKEHDSYLARHKSKVVRAQKKRLETQRATLRALLSPMRTLSNEILLYILEYVCEENLLQNYPWSSNEPIPTKLITPAITYLPAMAISSVCSRWRTLALSSPRLWANLRLESYAMFIQEEPPVGLIDTLKRYLERSGDWPIRLTLIIEGKGRELAFFTHLARNAYRWRTFTFCATYPFALYKTLSQVHFPLLEELDLHSYSESVLLSDLDCFEHSTRLCSLATDALPASKFPCNQLDRLTFRRAPSEELAEAMPNCLLVKSLSIELDNEDILDSFEVGTWRKVTSLVVRGYSRLPHLEMMFYSFDFPSLDVLEISSEERLTRKKSIIWPGHSFISFVSRSSCSITTFTLCGVSLTDLDLIAALPVMPSLLHLKIDDDIRVDPWEQQSPITPHLISRLHHSPSTSLVPKLHSLCLISCLSQAFDDHAFVSMVQSRWFKPGSELSETMLAIGRVCIRSVVLKFEQREVDAEVYEPLRILDKAGLRVVVSGTNGVQV